MAGAHAAIVSGFDSTSLGRTDDGSSAAVDIGFDFNFYGTTYTQLFVNNNGNVTFTAPQRSYTPYALTGATALPIIAPFFADVDTRNAASGIVSYGQGSYNGHAAFGVNYPGVGYFSSKANKLNTFQLILVDRSDIAAGDVDILFNYGSMQFESGESSGGVNGVGGSSAHAGYSNGTGMAGTFFEIAGSGVNGALIDGGANALNGKTFTTQERAGTIVAPPVATDLPEPASFALLGLGLAGMAALRRKSAK